MGCPHVRLARLQIRTIVRGRSSTGVSLGYLRVLFVGFVLWLSYGVALGNTALMVTNAVSILACRSMFAVAHRYRPTDSR